MGNTLGIIFSNIHDSSIPELTKNRTLASIPFCGRYRLIDFPLSNMVNSDITKVGVITKSNYQSLMDHVGSGKDWDLARRHGGLRILPPFGVQESNALYNNRLEALKGIISFLLRSNEEYVVMTDCDLISNTDYDKIVKTHIAKHADMTLLYYRGRGEEVSNSKTLVFELDESERIVGASIGIRSQAEANIFANVFVMKRALLINLVQDAMARGKHSFSEDIIIENLKTLKIYGYKNEGYFIRITSLNNYYWYSLELLNKEQRDNLFKGNSVYTKVRDSVPTKYDDNAVVKNSLIADGCEIEGTVENSIIFRGVHIYKDAVIKNSILMQDCIVGQNALVNCIVADKNVIIKDNRQLSGCIEHPFFLAKNNIV